MFGSGKKKAADTPQKNNAIELLNNRIVAVREELQAVANQLEKRLSDIERMMTILDEDFFELKQKTSDIEAASKSPQVPVKKDDAATERRIYFLEKKVKELLVFGKLSISNYEKLVDLEKRIEFAQEREQGLKEVILKEDSPLEKDRFSMLEKELELLKKQREEMLPE